MTREQFGSNWPKTGDWEGQKIYRFNGLKHSGYTKRVIFMILPPNPKKSLSVTLGVCWGISCLFWRLMHRGEESCICLAFVIDSSRAISWWREFFVEEPQWVNAEEMMQWKITTLGADGKIFPSAPKTPSEFRAEVKEVSIVSWI